MPGSAGPPARAARALTWRDTRSATMTVFAFVLAAASIFRPSPQRPARPLKGNPSFSILWYARAMSRLKRLRAAGGRRVPVLLRAGRRGDARLERRAVGSPLASVIPASYHY